jgi:caffeoyl-CoA O-methyltransferase
MKSFTDPAIADYTMAHTTADTALLKELQQIASEKLSLPDMICGPQVGQLLKTLVKTGNCKRVLEIGTFVGYSAISMADAMSEGEVITLEIEEEYAAISKPYFRREPYKNIIKQIIGPALDSLDSLEGPFDLAFIDADKTAYPEYYKKCLPLMGENGVMVFDNVLWSGEVIDPQSIEAKAIDGLNKMVHDDGAVLNLLLPLRDGVLIVVKKD